MIDLNERIGSAIRRASGELPEGYDLVIEIERGAAFIGLYIPPMGDEDSGAHITEFSGDDLPSHINNAIEMAIEHSSGEKQ